jgi:hypothetical protein
MKPLIFSIIYLALGAGMLGAYLLDLGQVFAIQAVLYLIVLLVDYTSEEGPV